MLGTAVDFGALTVIFGGSSTLAGQFGISNLPGGSIEMDHNLVLPGSLDVRGTFVNTGDREFTPPVDGAEKDWVLVLDDAASRFPPPAALSWGGGEPPAFGAPKPNI